MGGYSVERSVFVNVASHDVRRLVEDLHHWPQWSPWEDLDPVLERTYSGPDQGVGACYAWSGNRRAGKGMMEITGSGAEGIDIVLEFLRPIRSRSLTHFSFAPSGIGTEVRWRMTGEQKGMMAVLGRLVSMEKLIGPDFEKGLVRLKVVAEQNS